MLLAAAGLQLGGHRGCLDLGRDSLAVRKGCPIGHKGCTGRSPVDHPAVGTVARISFDRFPCIGKPSGSLRARRHDRLQPATVNNEKVILNVHSLRCEFRPEASDDE